MNKKDLKKQMKALKKQDKAQKKDSGYNKMVLFWTGLALFLTGLIVLFAGIGVESAGNLAYGDAYQIVLAGASVILVSVVFWITALFIDNDGSVKDWFTLKHSDKYYENLKDEDDVKEDTDDDDGDDDDVDVHKFLKSLDEKVSNGASKKNRKNGDK